MKFILCSICIILLCGCSRTKIIDQISIIHILGYDLNDKGELDGTLIFPDFTKSENSESLEIRQISGDSSGMLLQKSNEQTKNPIELSKTLVVIFGEDLAKNGIEEILEYIANNPLVGTNVQIAVAQNSAKDFLEEVKNSGTLAIADTITQNYKNLYMPRTNTHIFLNNFYGKGRDPYCPFLTLGSNGIVKVKGLAIWKDEQFKLTLNEQQSLTFGLLDHFDHEGIVEVPIEKHSKKGKLVLRNLKNKAKWNVINVGGKTEIRLILRLSTRIKEYPSWVHLHNEEDFALIKRGIKKKIDQDVTELIKLFQENNVDPLGLGDIVRAHSRSWNEKEFYQDQYGQLKVKVDTNVQIIQAGLRK